MILWLGGCGVTSRSGDVAAVPASPAITANIPIGPGPILLGLSDDGTRLYAIANDGFHVVDTSARQVIASLPTVANPSGLAISGAADRAYVTNLFSVHLAVIDTHTQTVLPSITLPSQATRPAYGSVAVSPDGAQAYVADRVGSNLMVVDTAQGTSQQLGLDVRPNDVALSPDGRWVYICGCKGFCAPGTVQRFDAKALRFDSTFSVGPSPYRVVVHPDGKTLYTANLGDGSVSVVDTESLTLKASVPVAVQLTGLAVSNDGKSLLAISRASGQLAAIDTATNAVLRKMKIGPEPRQVIFSPDDRLAYASTANSIVVIDAEMFDRATE